MALYAVNLNVVPGDHAGRDSFTPLVGLVVRDSQGCEIRDVLWVDTGTNECTVLQRDSAGGFVASGSEPATLLLSDTFTVATDDTPIVGADCFITDKKLCQDADQAGQNANTNWCLCR